MLSDELLTVLRETFQACDYAVDPVLSAIGTTAHAALGRNQTTPGLRALAGRDDELATLIRLWPLQSNVGRAEADRALAGRVGELAAAGVLTCEQDRVSALIDLRPYASDDGASGWIFSDLTPGLDGARITLRPDYVLGVSPASTSLAQLAVRTPVDLALDLGTGCGVQSLHLARHARRVIATDLNRRALGLAALTAAINEVEIDFRAGDLYAPIADEQFDLIITNPPYVIAPPSTDDDRLVYREGGLLGDEFVRRVVTEGAARLAPGGTLQVLGNWAQPEGQDWHERPQGWIESTGCDGHVVRREVLDAAEYIEIWLADAGLTGTPDYTGAYRRWADYFERLGITSVGMGWLNLVRAGRDQPSITVEDWPHPVEQPIGPALAERMDAVELDRRLSDDDLLAAHWTLAPDVVQESYERPGSADPYAIVLTQQVGFRRAVEVDTALAGVLGACDGELSLAQVLAAVASIMDVDLGALTAEILPKVRRLSVDRLLWP